MSLRLSGVVSVILGVGMGALAQPAPWHEQLSYPGQAYWSVRVPVDVENASGLPLTGTPVTLTLQEGDGTTGLLGEPAESLRVVTAAGEEFLFDVRDSNGVMKRTGTLAAGDKVTLPVEADTGATARFFLYAGNPEAWPPMDWLNAGLQNPGFEGPGGWDAASTSAAHRMAIQEGGAYKGERCARCEVDPGASPEWVKYGQSGLPVAEGQRYRFTAWVRAEGVVGNAGWFIHVNGDRPQMVNRVEGWDGSFDWREVAIEFDVPEGGRSFACGTVLYGTGTAWYDDAKLELLSDESTVSVQVGAAERMELASNRTELPKWPSDDWQLASEVLVRNFTDEPVERLVGVHTRRVANQQFKFSGNSWNCALNLVDDAGNALAAQGQFDDTLYVATTLPPRTEKRVWLYSRASDEPAHFVGENTRLGSFDSLSQSAWNLIANGSMVEGEGPVPRAWELPEEGLAEGGPFRMRRIPGGVDKNLCLELQVPKNTANPGWVGWRQRIDVKPNTQYLLAGYIKSEGIDGPASIHVHKHRASGELTESPFMSSRPEIEGTDDWTLTKLAFTTPPDCAYINLHLTMNRHGTLWHDALTLIESGTAVDGRIWEASELPNSTEPLKAWSVNPLIKTFPHDRMPPGEPHQKIEAYAARNTRESVQIAVRSGEDEAVAVYASVLTGPNGVTLAAPTVSVARYVPVDFPIGYHSTESPEYHRLLPEGRGNDGWAGLWPDALLPVAGEVTLAASTTESLWFEFDVPPDAVPGAYTGTLTLHGRTRELTLPVTVTVWNFTVPTAKHLPALYDLRNGPGWDLFGGGDRQENIRKWCEFLARYNVSPALTIESPQFSLENGKVTMETAAFDAYASYVFDELKVNALYTPHIFYACGWAYEPRDFLGHKAFTPEYVQAWTDAYRMFVEHITEKGWRGKFVHYLSDEPFESSEKTITGLARVADMARSVAPDVPVYSSTWRYIEGLENHLTLWGVGIHESFPLDKIRERQAAGDRFWFTTDGHMCTDTPFLAVERLLPWLCFKYGVEGYEFWGVSWWTYDPHVCGWHKYIRQSNEGEKYYWVRYPNGDGFLAYPSPDGGAAEPLPTIRLLAARGGVDDYELALALQKHAVAGNKEAQAALDRVSRAVAMTRLGGRYSTSLMPDPDEIQAARIELGQVLSKLE